MSAQQEEDEYRKRVIEELKRREERLSEIESEISKKMYMITEYGSGKKVISGDSSVIRASHAYRSKLRTELVGLKKKREELLQEVEMAKERLSMIEEES